MFKKLRNNRGLSFGMMMILVGASLITGGEIMRQRGEWGKDGEKAVKNCVGTHTNGNCAHLPLTAYEKNTFDWNQ